MLPHLRPVSLCSKCCRGPSAVIVTVSPNSTAPASVVKFGWALKYSAMRPVSLQQFHRLQRRDVVARRAQIVAMQVERVRHGRARVGSQDERRVGVATEQ
jgi:hypothetical protein